MSEQLPEVPTRRGRRDPQIASMLEAEGMMSDEREGPVESGADYQLMPGDVIMAKTTLAYRTPVGDGWSTFGAQPSVTTMRGGSTGASARTSPPPVSTSSAASVRRRRSARRPA